GALLNVAARIQRLKSAEEVTSSKEGGLKSEKSLQLGVGEVAGVAKIRDGGTSPHLWVLGLACGLVIIGFWFNISVIGLVVGSAAAMLTTIETLILALAVGISTRRY